MLIQMQHTCNRVRFYHHDGHWFWGEMIYSIVCNFAYFKSLRISNGPGITPYCTEGDKGDGWEFEATVKAVSNKEHPFGLNASTNLKLRLV